MGIGKILLFVGVRMLAFVVTAVGIGFDVSGTSLMGFSPDGLRIMVIIAIAVFFALTFWREIDLRLSPQPRVEYTGLSFDTANNGYFTRIVFKNNAKGPTGQESIAQALAAVIRVYKDSNLIDTWNGRWAVSDRPMTHGDIARLNCYDLKPNTEEGILDVGFRLKGEKHFKGYDNLHYFVDRRVSIKPDSYNLEVELGASNWGPKRFWFALDVPDEPQSDDPKQVKITLIQKPKTCKEGSQA